MPFLQGTDVYQILRRIGATTLYHANTVSTSCTFLRKNGLMSRELVQKLGLEQTPQSSDDKDRKLGIWDCIFLDHVDIHDRGGAKKGPNVYGPVLFHVDLDILLDLPPGSKIRVTRSNPIYWDQEDPDDERWFRNSDELSTSIHFGNYEKMIVIQAPSEKLEFPNRHAAIILDDPGTPLSSGKSAYASANSRLRTAALDGQVDIQIKKRACPNDCICQEVYAGFSDETIDRFFS